MKPVVYQNTINTLKMRKNTVVFIAMLCTVLACGDEKFGPGDTTFGHAEATVNGETWEASGWANAKLDSNYYYLPFFTVNKHDEIRESLSFTIPRKTGSFSVNLPDNLDVLVAKSSFSTSISDGDVLEDLYIVDTLAPNFVNVTEIDTSTGTIKGTFQCLYRIRLRADGTKGNPENPDVIDIKGGAFEVIIKD